MALNSEKNSISRWDNGLYGKMNTFGKAKSERSNQIWKEKGNLTKLCTIKV